MSKYRILIGLAVVVTLLTVAWFASGMDSSAGDIGQNREQIVAKEVTTENETSEKDFAGQKTELTQQDNSAKESAASQENLAAPKLDATQTVAANQQPDFVQQVESTQVESTNESSAAQQDESVLRSEPTEEVKSAQPAESSSNTEKPTSDSFVVTLSVRCDTILVNMDQLTPEKRGLVPPNGVIFPVTQVPGYSEENVFNILQREMKKAGIQLEFTQTPLYNSAYIESINNLYEFDVGELSGWMYKVNGEFPGYGCSRYQIKSGDVIEFLYSCDLGYDIGGQAAREGQKS